MPKAISMFGSGGFLDIPKGKPLPKTGRKNSPRTTTGRAKKEGGKCIYFGVTRLEKIRERAAALAGGNISAYISDAVDFGMEIGTDRMGKLRALAERNGKSPGAIVDELVAEAARKAGSR